MNSPRAQENDKHKAMAEAGQIIFDVKQKLRDFSQVGVSFAQIDSLARKLIEGASAQTNFDLEPGYKWACCVNRNSGIVHGIPHADQYINDGDVMKIDLGCSIRGWNVDTSFSFIAGNDLQNAAQMLGHGRRALEKSISYAKVGNSIYDLSYAMEKDLVKRGYDMVFELTGHGIGKKMHESPYIPCVAQRSDKKLKLIAGQTVAIEVMYALGDAKLVEAKDGWTYATRDGSLTGYFEETVLINNSGAPTIITNPEYKQNLIFG